MGVMGNHQGAASTSTSRTPNRQPETAGGTSSTSIKQTGGNSGAAVVDNSEPSDVGEKWYYIDLQGIVQGPFSTFQMLKWYDGDLLPESLQVRTESDPANSFFSLQDRCEYISQWTPGSDSYDVWHQKKTIQQQPDTTPDCTTITTTEIHHPPTAHHTPTPNTHNNPSQFESHHTPTPTPTVIPHPTPITPSPIPTPTPTPTIIPPPISHPVTPTPTIIPPPISPPVTPTPATIIPPPISPPVSPTPTPTATPTPTPTVAHPPPTALPTQTGSFNNQPSYPAPHNPTSQRPASTLASQGPEYETPAVGQTGVIAPSLPPRQISNVVPVQQETEQGFPEPGKLYGFVSFAYTASQSDELTIAYNQIVEMIPNHSAPTAWEYVRILRTGAEGLVPGNYIKPLPDLSQCPRAVASADWTPPDEPKPGHCLRLKKGDRIVVVEQHVSGWWTGLSNGLRGMYPKHFCSI